jgi:hypothetical protein
MPGSSTQQNIANFVKGNYGDLPDWAQPNPSDLKGNAALGLPQWAQPPAKGPSALSQIGGGPQPPTKAELRQQAAQARAQQKAAAAQQRAADKAGAAQQRAAAQAQQRAAQQSQAMAIAAGNVGIGAATAGTNMAQGISDFGQGIVNWAENWPTPGGIGLLLLVIFILLWALIPVDKEGYTRLQLLWFTVMGRTSLQGSTAQKNAATVAAMSDVTSPLLGVTGLGAAVQSTTQDFSVSPSQTSGNGAYPLTTY